MLPNLRSILKIKIIVLTTVASSFINLALATGLAHSQGLEKRISIDIQNKPLKQTLDQIAARAQMVIIYSNAKGIIEKPVTVHEKDQPVSKVLNELLSPLSLTYEVIDDRIVIKFDNSSSRPPSQEKPPFPVKGKVTDANGSPLPGATIKIKNGPAIATNGNGEFQITDVADSTILQVSFVGYLTKEIVVRKAEFLTIVLEIGSAQLNEVVVSTGYQTLPKERATGSFVQLDSAIINRRVSTDIISRLEGVVPGLLFNRNTISSANGTLDLGIRGHSTLFANDQPLVVVDNFPYDGDINNINPNDIASITVLKDAAAASIWGVRSGNGVIVLTTKKGKINQPLSIDFSANVTIGDKPNAFYSPYFLDSKDYISVEKTLFNSGFYTTSLNSSQHPVVSPVVQLLADQQAGKITSDQLNTQLNALGKIDVRNDIEKYLYRKGIDQQYALSLHGGNNKSTYYFSTGYDDNLSSLVGNKNNRLTINSGNTFRPVNNLELSASLFYSQSNTTSDAINNLNNGGNYTGLFPYTTLADANGNPLPIVKDYNYSWITNTASQNGLLNWQYYPLNELQQANNTSTLNDIRIISGLKYGFWKGFNAEVKYQYEKSNTVNKNNYNQDTYYARNLINQYSTINGATVTNNIPVGGILQQSNSDLSSQRLRGQLNFEHTWNELHQLNVLGGTEINQTVTNSNAFTAYGYNDQTETFQNVNFVTAFKTIPSGTRQIPNNEGFSKFTNRYISYFSNAAYTYADRYIFSLSGRIDKSNLFGVNTNQKSVPLYSTGLAWIINKESFYNVNWLPALKLRATYGYNANIDNNVAAVTTIRQFNNSTYSGVPYSIIINPANPDLRWEKVRMINLGTDFSFKNDILSGSFEYYLKDGIDLFGDSPLPPSSGLLTFRGNTADTKGHGLDVTINSRNFYKGKFKWYSNFILSYNLDKVTKYDVSQTSTNALANGAGNSGTILPIINSPLFAIYSYKWGGLSHNTGDPQGFLNGKLSTDYTSILANTSLKDLKYNGPSRPTTFGSLRNTFSFDRFALSFNLIYKFNYYFRRPSISYSALYNTGLGNVDFSKRWQKPGDEQFTNVPSMPALPVLTSRDAFYQYSETLVDKGDHIRLQDATLSYDFDKNNWKGIPFKHLQIYCYANNIGIIWRANHGHLDPDLYSFQNAYPIPRTIAFGIKTTF
ncbi:SusC/RagA family TonB-linked outer membrane protein [Mucilaginibacter paludis]|uniref:TonB-dependent receptor n=1 Tax=Mucilaginibacter paludis DSM 18603 TaxID=714943 RepID=H1YHI0_9SPHI|nr:SusC/RagA family TonB-linked outer membrane protein [Mucilaginibacter paludis]EHQ26403.1 TonB-dependent receptor [Mucilaginibacter paludis DSM 18603]